MAAVAAPVGASDGVGPEATDAQERSSSKSEEGNGDPGQGSEKPDVEEEIHPSALDLHAEGVSDKIRQLTWRRAEVNYFLRNYTDASNLEQHTAAVLKANAPVSFYERRSRQLENACLKQQQLLQERKNRKREKMSMVVAAVTAEKTKAAEEGIEVKFRAGAEVDEAVAEAADHARAWSKSGDTNGEDKLLTWTTVERFKTHEEALRFVMKCQPFDFLPLGVDGELIRFPSNADPFAQAVQLQPLPRDFVSTVEDFKRRLRIRHRPEMEEDAREIAARNTLSKLLSGKAGRSRMAGRIQAALGDGSIPVLPLSTASKDPKPFHVEAAGKLFERPPSWRSKRDGSGRYYIAVSPDIEKKVLAEGYRIKKRTSIPCSATPQEAIAHFKHHLPNVTPVVLPLSLPPHIEVVAHKEGGFLIKARELPPSCFKVASSRRA